MCLSYEYYQRETINKSLLEKAFKIIKHKETIVTAKQLETTTRPTPMTKNNNNQTHQKTGAVANLSSLLCYY